MLRWCFRLLAVVSLLLCAAAVTFWVRSHYCAWDRWEHGLGPRFFVLSCRGTLTVQWDGDLQERSQASTIFRVNLWAAQYESRSYVRESPHFRQVVIRYWILPPLFLLGPALLVLARWRRRRQAWRAGLCQTCGYDLRAHAPGQNCPECGTRVPNGPTGVSAGN
jgi:hypothetical protein